MNSEKTKSVDLLAQSSREVYKDRRFRLPSPERRDPESEVQSNEYAEVMKMRQIERESVEIAQRLSQQRSRAQAMTIAEEASTSSRAEQPPRRRRRWDMPTPDTSADEATKHQRSEWDERGTASVAVTPRMSRWDATPVSHEAIAETPRRSKSRWDETPVHREGEDRGNQVSTSFLDPQTFFPRNIVADPEQALNLRWERELEARNRYMTDEEISGMLPSEGFTVLEPPENYVPVTPSRKLTATPAVGAIDGFQLAEAQDRIVPFSLQPADADLPAIKAEDYQYFGSLVSSVNPDEMTIEEAKKRKVLKLLLKIKSGTPPMRRQALRQITEKARDFGANLLLDAILPIFMSPTLEESERHALVKVVDRILLRLGEGVRPYVHKILVVVAPLLIEENYYARVEGREIISNLAKAAGLATMIAALRPDIDHADEFVRNTTARTFAVIASALGVHSLLPFLKAVCRSKKSWMARHTGMRMIQQIAILLGYGVLSHLRSLVECVSVGLEDEQLKIRLISTLALSALAEASSPHGIEAFNDIIDPLWKSVRNLRGKSLAAALKAIGNVIAIMRNEDDIEHYVREIMPILVKEFGAPDDEEKRIIMRVLHQCISKMAVSSSYIKTEIFTDFFKNFWVRRLVMDRRNIRPLQDLTIEFAGRVGVSHVVSRLAALLKDENEALRRVANETLANVLKLFSAADVDPQVEKLIIDGTLYLFQEHTVDDPGNHVMSAIGATFQALGVRMRPYLVQISSLLLWRLAHRTAKIRQYSADLAASLAPIIAECHEDDLLNKLSVVFYENLGEEYPDVLASILGALRAVLSAAGPNRMRPSPKDLLPRLTPILRNRNERVQENCMNLIGSLAEVASEAVSPREWMRICFELLDLLKTPRKSTRRAAIVTFGHIARAVGPHDVLAALLNNLKVQERTNRVATTLAIAIVAENCAPFTVLPALMNEYRVPEMNVQNGVLKSISFTCEYIGELVKDYIYAITPLLDDALQDRDQVHRQTASMAVKHMALGTIGFGCDDALVHLLNAILPNLFDSNPHLIMAVIESVDALRLAVGPSIILHYLVQVYCLFVGKILTIFFM